MVTVQCGQRTERKQIAGFIYDALNAFVAPTSLFLLSETIFLRPAARILGKAQPSSLSLPKGYSRTVSKGIMVGRIRDLLQYVKTCGRCFLLKLGRYLVIVDS